MFWNVGLYSQSTLDQLFEKGDFTLEEVLEDPDVLQEVKSHSKKIIDYVTAPDKMERLIQYATEVPMNKDALESDGFKYAHVSAEILASEVWAVCEALTSDENLLTLLFFVLENDPPLNPLTASYFAKIVSVLLTKNSSKMIAYIRRRPGNFIKELTKHLDCSAMKDVVIKLYQSIRAREDPEKTELLQWLDSKGLVEELMFMPKTTSARAQAHAATTLMELISEGRSTETMHGAEEDPEAIKPDLIMQKLEDADLLSKYIASLFEDGADQNKTVDGLEVLQALLGSEREGITMSAGPIGIGGILIGGGEDLGSEGSVTGAMAEMRKERSKKALQSMLPHFPQFAAQLDKEPDFTFVSTAGEMKPPLGLVRLRVVHLVVLMCKADLEAMAQPMLETGGLDKILDLFFKYQWNSFLHKHVNELVEITVEYLTGENAPTEKNDVHKLFADDLLTKLQLPKRVMDTVRQHPFEGKTLHPGHTGHLHLIGLHLNDAYTSEKVTKLIDFSASEELKPADWDKFVEDELDPWRNMRDRALGGIRPRTSLEEDSFGSGTAVDALVASASADEALMRQVYAKYLGAVPADTAADLIVDEAEIAGGGRTADDMGDETKNPGLQAPPATPVPGQEAHTKTPDNTPIVDLSDAFAKTSLQDSSNKPSAPLEPPTSIEGELSKGSIPPTPPPTPAFGQDPAGAHPPPTQEDFANFDEAFGGSASSKPAQNDDDDEDEW
eukprot:Clim_evm52s246 gene=Clim_evmTU52s246